MDARSGIAPIIAFLIVLAISIALILALLTWIHGVNRAIQHDFMVRPSVFISRATARNGIPIVVLYIQNNGPAVGKIIRVEVLAGNGEYVYVPPNGSIIIKPNTQTTVVIPPPGQNWTIVGSPSLIQPGFMYRIRVYLSSGAILIYDVTAEQR